MKFLSFMFTLAICTILKAFTQVNIKILLIQSYHTTCVSFSCEFILKSDRCSVFLYSYSTFVIAAEFSVQMIITDGMAEMTLRINGVPFSLKLT